jgi:hypothetical protein
VLLLVLLRLPLVLLLVLPQLVQLLVLPLLVLLFQVRHRLLYHLLLCLHPNLSS